jgi:hypothetical protein
VNFEAEVHFPEDEDIVQVEHMGVHVDHLGNVVYGVRLEAIMANAPEHLSLDLLSRVMADLQQDSSTLIDSLVAEHQRSLLDITYYGDRANRDKFTLLVAEGITPRMPAARYLDKEDFENELKQVLGDTHVAYDLGREGEGLMVMGSQGILLVQPDALSGSSVEQTLAGYLFLDSA